jgi:dTDP-glucose pyrophosphorylase
MNNVNLKNREISADAEIIDALKKMDLIDKKLLIILKNNKFLGLLSAGDIQRAIIKNTSLNTNVLKIVRNNFKIARPGDNLQEIKKLIFDYRMEFCPVVDGENNIVNVFFWEDLFKDLKPTPKRQFNLPVIVMAGGFGTRMRPLTNVLPKALIPINEKSIIENIFDQFNKHGCDNFKILLNYKSELIKFYLKKQNLPYRLSFYEEEKPLGTGGGLSLLKGIIKQTFFVSNCDILIEQDFSEILDYHENNQNEITVVAALKTYSIPYGTIESGENGEIKKWSEKPDLTIKINSGIYILEPHLISEVPNNSFYHITNLVEQIIRRQGKVGIFPVSEKSWKDMGEWTEYLKICGSK